MTTTVRRWTSMLLSFSARRSSGTRTARAGAVTSATNVVFESDLMTAGTESGLAIHLTRAGMCGARSSFARVVQRAFAHLFAAVETYQMCVSTCIHRSMRTTHLRLRVVHCSFDFGDRVTENIRDVGPRSRADPCPHRIQDACIPRSARAHSIEAIILTNFRAPFSRIEDRL